MQAVVLAGGLATRMRPRTLTTPKLLLEVAGRPFVDWQLEKLASAGYSDVLLCIAHLGEQVESYVGNGKRYGLRVDYAREGDKLLGTWGALRGALSKLESTFLVTYGDSYLPFDYAAPLRLLAASPDCDGVMSVYKNLGKYDASNVRTSETWVLAYEKGTNDPAFDHIDYGALALRRAVIGALPPGEVAGLERLQSELAAAHKLRALTAERRFFEIGSPEGLDALDAELRATAAAAAPTNRS